MTRSKLIAGRIREVYSNGTWIANTNFKDLILNIPWQTATQKVENLNTIAELTFHINYYLVGLLHAFETGKLEISDQFSFNMKPIQSAQEWESLRSDFLLNAEKFANRVEQLADQTLDEIFIDQRYGTYLRNIEGVIEHSYYHLGQISLIRKMIDLHK
ncbi:MAG: DinB family protein [Crocinitomix sp.]|nr:DinB family protein [Crocinitomix sp.]